MFKLAHVIGMANNENPATMEEILETTLYWAAIAHDSAKQNIKTEETNEVMDKWGVDWIV